MRWIREHRFASSTGYRHLISALTYDGARLSQSGAICVATDFDQQLYRVLLSAESEKWKQKKKRKDFAVGKWKCKHLFLKLHNQLLLSIHFICFRDSHVQILFHFWCSFVYFASFNSLLLSLFALSDNTEGFFYFQTWRKKQEKPINKYEKFHVVCDGVCFWLVSMMKTFCVERLAGKNFSHRHLS